MTAATEEDARANKLFLSSIVVGVVGLGLATIYLVDGSPNDSNVGFWLYTPISMFFLWPCQVILAIKLHALDLVTSSAAHRDQPDIGHHIVAPFGRPLLADSSLSLLP